MPRRESLRIELAATLAVGDGIHIRGYTADLTEKVQSMPAEHAQITEAKAGESIGLIVSDHVRIGAKVFLVI